MENKTKQYIKKLIIEEITKTSLTSFVNQVLKLAKPLGLSNSNLIVLRDSLFSLITKLVESNNYGEPQKKMLIRTINQIFVGNNETAKPPKFETEEELKQFMSNTFPNGNPVGSIIIDYAGYKYKVWKWNKAALYMVCESLDDNKVYWVDTEELLKGFDKIS